MAADESAAEHKADQDYLWKRREALKVRALSNRLYQLERQRIMERREGVVKVASLAAGSVAVAKVTDANVIRDAVAVIFIGTGSSLVFGWGNKARDASKRAVEWVSIDVEIDAAGERGFTEAQLDSWAARCNSIEAGEPAQHRVLFEQCYRRACESLGLKPTSGGPTYRWWLPFMFIP